MNQKRDLGLSRWSGKHALVGTWLTATSMLLMAPKAAQPAEFEAANLVTSAKVGHGFIDSAVDPQGNGLLAYRLEKSRWVNNVVAKVNPQCELLWSEARLPHINTLVTDATGGIYVAGSVLSGLPTLRITPDDYLHSVGLPATGTGTAYVAKLNASGGLEWIRQIGGAQANAEATGIAVDAERNYYVAGFYTGGAAEFGVHALPAAAAPPGNVWGTQNYFVTKYSPGGQLQWVRAGITKDSWTGYLGFPRLTSDDAGQLVLLGQGGTAGYNFEGTAIPPSPLFLVRFDPAGKILWIRSAEEPDLASLGAGCVGIDRTGSVFLVANTWNLQDSGLRSSPVLQKYGPAGELLWQRQPEVIAGEIVSRALAVDQSGNCYLASTFEADVRGTILEAGKISFDGQIARTSAASELVIVKYSSAGELRWLMQTEGQEPHMNWIDGDWSQRVSDLSAAGLSVDSSGGVFVSGVLAGTVLFGPVTLTGPNNLVAGENRSSVFATHVRDPEAAPPPSRLSIERSARQLRVRWPASETRVVLESLDALSSTLWTEVTVPPGLEGGQAVVALEIGTGTKFFRLRQ